MSWKIFGNCMDLDRTACLVPLRPVLRLRSAHALEKSRTRACSLAACQLDMPWLGIFTDEKICKEHKL